MVSSSDGGENMAKCGYSPRYVLTWIYAGERKLVVNYMLYNTDGSIHYVKLDRNGALANGYQGHQ